MTYKTHSIANTVAGVTLENVTATITQATKAIMLVIDAHKVSEYLESEVSVDTKKELYAQILCDEYNHVDPSNGMLFKTYQKFTTLLMSPQIVFNYKMWTTKNQDTVKHQLHQFRAEAFIATIIDTWRTQDSCVIESVAQKKAVRDGGNTYPFDPKTDTLSGIHFIVPIFNGEFPAEFTQFIEFLCEVSTRCVVFNNEMTEM